MNELYAGVETRETGTGDNRPAKNITGLKKWIGPLKTQNTVSPYQDLSSTRHVERIEFGGYTGTLRQTNEGRYILKIEDINKNPVFNLKTYESRIYWFDATDTNPDIIGLNPFWKHTDLVHSIHNKSPVLEEVISDETVSKIASSLLRELKYEKQTKCFENADDFWDKIQTDDDLIAIYLI